MGFLTRRQFIGAAAGLSLVSGTAPLPAAGLAIQPRSAWGADHPPKGPLAAEEVKFLIVHHSASNNGHTAADVPRILRSWYEFHTGPQKGWNDVAYNFVIDSEGGIWEARQGSISGPVAGDATGGNQGFTQLVALIGNYDTAHPAPAALDSLVRLSGWLADRYGISTAPGATVSFASRGSNSWPAGTMVTTPTITGHRTMSKTSCPGDNLYGYVAGGLMADVETARAGVSPTTTVAVAPPSTGAVPESTTTTVVPSTTSSVAVASTTVPATSTTVSAMSSSTNAATTTASSPSTTPAAAAATTTTVIQTSTTNPPTTTRPTTTTSAALAVSGADPIGAAPVLIAGGTLAALATALVLWRRRRMTP